MTIELDRLVQNLDPDRTILFFGAGSSIPSGSPSATNLASAIAERFGIDPDGFSLAEIAELAELNADRAKLITFVRDQFPHPNPTGGLLNIPLFGWKGIYTTNYDELLERTYQVRKKPYTAITTNYDFSKLSGPLTQPLYKIHGSIGHDVSDGSKSRMILTQGDYDKAIEYREYLYTRLASDMAGADLVIIGFSLSDPDIKAVVDRVLSIQSKMGGAGGQVYLLLYQKDENRARLYEARGVRVAFGGIDEFSEVLARKGPSASVIYSSSNDPVQQSNILSATTIEVKHSIENFASNASAMFNGWPATYADVAADLTFGRTLSNTIFGDFKLAAHQYASIVGASGVGKTTAARQVAVQADAAGWLCWEHKVDFSLSADEWAIAAEKLQSADLDGLLVIDEANFHIAEINRLVEALATKGLTRLRLILTSSRAQWQYRTKSVFLTKHGKEHKLSKLNSQEVDRLILLVSAPNDVRPLVEATFSGFSFPEKRRRLVERCEADAFVCLRNIFATEKFDDIILREYAQMSVADQEIYRLVSAMQNAGIRVHRQLLIRLASIAADMVESALDNLVDVISEYDISVRFGVYGWKVRHSVIAGIIAKYKFADPAAMLELFERVIKNISPTYEIERRTINEMCNVETGLPSIADKKTQNRLLRTLISVAPGEPIPRHRLIRNLISLEKFDLAETEIRVFKHDIGVDGPVARYQVVLLLARAMYTPGLMDEDRLVILRQAESQAAASAEKYRNNRQVLMAYCDVGLELIKQAKDEACLDAALKALKEAEIRTGDEMITKSIRHYERRRFEIKL